MQIGRKDVLWNYAATILQIGAGVILLPFILKVFPRETVAIWTIFSTIVTLSGMFDFGFNPSFARNVSYVVSGVKELKKNGFQIVENNNEVDYGLFKGIIDSMRWFYGRIAFILFVLLISVGTYYIKTILKTYPYNHLEVYISWFILCTINSYSLYTLYYDSLMQGQGFVKRAKQIQMTGQIIYLVVAAILIILKFNLIAIVSAQALSILVRRALSYRTVFTAEFKQRLQSLTVQSRKDILKVIYPNAVKIGLTSIGGFLVLRSSIIIGSLYLSLETIASYGITMQIISIIGGIASVYFTTYQPKIVQLRTQNNLHEIKHTYVRACFLLLATYLICGISLLYLGNLALYLIGSKTPLLHQSVMALALVVALLETNHSMAGSILLTKNEVPFFKASLFSGVVTVILLFVFLKYTQIGVWGMVLAPGIAQGCYQNWHWPAVVIKELNKNIC